MDAKVTKAKEIIGDLVPGGANSVKYRNLFADIDNSVDDDTKYEKTDVVFKEDRTPIDMYKKFAPKVAGVTWTQAQQDNFCKAITLLATASSTKKTGGFYKWIYPMVEKRRFDCEDAKKYLVERRKHKNVFDKIDDSVLDRLKVICALLIWDIDMKSSSGPITITIPAGTTAIAKREYRGQRRLKTVVIPNGVTIIGDDAFAGCESLESVTIPNGVTTIGDGAFSHCTSLESITIPNSVTTMGGVVFADCYSLEAVTIPSGVTDIGDGAFSHCTSLRSITIPNGVTTIFNNAFYGCKDLESVTIPSSVDYIGMFAFDGCKNLKTLIVDSPTLTLGYGIHSVFSECRNLTDISQIQGRAPLAIKQQILAKIQADNS